MSVKSHLIFKVLLAVISSIVIASCSSSMVTHKSVYDYAGCTTASCINEGLLDTTKIDTVIFQKKYEEFISGKDTLSRSAQKMNVFLSKIKTELITGLQSEISADSSNSKFNLFITPDGKIEITPFRFPSQVDSNVLKNLSAKISNGNNVFPVVTGLWVSREIEVRNGELWYDSINVYSSGKGGRSKTSIMNLVIEKLSYMRYAYNRRLVAARGLQGKITVKFAINYLGTVIYSNVIESTVGDELLETAIRDQVATWKFEPIFKKRDVTEVIYPFVFSQ